MIYVYLNECQHENNANKNDNCKMTRLVNLIISNDNRRKTSKDGK